MKRTVFCLNLTAAVLILGSSGCASRPWPARPAAPAPSPLHSSTNLPLSTPGSASASDSTSIQEPAGSITLRDALALALKNNLELAPFSWDTRLNEARTLQASLRPNPELSLQVEDIAGTGKFRGGREAQTTLQLSQLIELGGQRAARVQASLLAQDVTRTEYELKRVEVLAEVAQRFIQVVAHQHFLDLAMTNRQLAAEALQTVQFRAAAGKSSALEERKSQVALARSEVLIEGAKHELTASRKKLAASWRNSSPTFLRAEADMFAVQSIPSFETLTRRISSSPQITRLLSEKTMREAEVRLAEARRRPNLTVWGGARRLETSSDHTFLLGISVPLQIFDRNQAGTAEAQALLGRSEADLRALEARLTVLLLGLYEELLHKGHVMEGLQKDILPKAEEALAISRDGFAEGRFSYLDVLDAQRTVFDVTQEYIQTAASYHQFLVEIERLIGQPIPNTTPQ